MSDYRYQPFTDQWVLVAGNRQERPNEFVPSSQRVEQQVCPFCRGNESETPETLAAYPAYPNSQDWDVRVFPNKYPALRPVPSQSMQHRGPYVQRDGFGIHELIVLSSRHVESLSELSQDECRLSMIAFQDRLRAAYAEPETQHAVLFQNCRHEAGASIQHVHCQLIATSVVPAKIEQRWKRDEDHFRQQGESLLQALVNWEISEADRIIDQNGPWVLFCPFASGTPFQLWLTSTGPGEKHDFFSQSEVQLEQLAELLQRAVIRLESVLPNVPYNFVVHVPPRSFIEKPISPCLIEIFPRINKTAGFEWATDCLINQVPPELAARQLRNNQEK